MSPDAYSFYEYLAIFAAAGFASGFVSGFFGIGGGFVRIPLFLLVFPYFAVSSDLVMHVAVATSLALGIPSGIMTLRRRMTSGTFDGRYFRGWAVGLCAGTLIGAALFPYMPATAMKVLYIIVLLVFAIYFGVVPDTIVLRPRPPRGLARFFVSVGISSYAVMTGVGSGSANTFAMKASSMPLPRAMSIGTASALVINVLGAAGCMWTGWDQSNLPQWNIGFVNGMVFAVMVPGILLASGWGARLSLRTDKKVLKQTYAEFLVIITGYMIYKLVG